MISRRAFFLLPFLPRMLSLQIPQCSPEILACSPKVLDKAFYGEAGVSGSIYVVDFSALTKAFREFGEAASRHGKAFTEFQEKLGKTGKALVKLGESMKEKNRPA